MTRYVGKDINHKTFASVRADIAQRISRSTSFSDLVARLDVVKKEIKSMQSNMKVEPDPIVGELVKKAFYDFRSEAAKVIGDLIVQSKTATNEVVSVNLGVLHPDYEGIQLAMVTAEAGRFDDVEEGTYGILRADSERDMKVIRLNENADTFLSEIQSELIKEV